MDWACLFNWKPLILGGLPPLLAIIAEIRNPASGELAKEQSTDKVEKLISRKEGQSEPALATDREAAARLVGDTAEGAIEVSGVIPTFISVIAGLSALCLDELKIGVIPVLSAVLIVTAVTSLFGITAFQKIHYESLATTIVDAWPCRGMTQAKRLSLGLVVLNAAVILLAGVLTFEGLHACHPHSMGNPTTEQGH